MSATESLPNIAAEGTKVVARLPFTYFHELLDRGQVTTLKGTARDAQLLGLKYFIPYDPVTMHRLVCDMCSRTFISDAMRTAHKSKASCNADTQLVTKSDVAALLEKDVKDVQVEELPAFVARRE